MSGEYIEKVVRIQQDAFQEIEKNVMLSGLDIYEYIDMTLRSFYSPDPEIDIHVHSMNVGQLVEFIDRICALSNVDMHFRSSLWRVIRGIENNN